MFTLAISCLTTSNLPWFMDLTFQVHLQYCCLQSCKFYFHHQWTSELFSRDRPFAIPWTVAYQSASSTHGIFQAKVLEWVAISFSRGSSWPRDWTQASHITGRLFTVWATREATRHIHNWVSFLLWLSLFILSGAISPLFPSSILDTSCPGRSSPISYLFAFS